MPQIRDKTKEDKAILAEQVRLGRDLRSDEIQKARLSVYGDDPPEELSMASGPNITDLKSQLDLATERTQEFNAPSSSLDILQGAIRTRNKSADIPLGESKIFQEAGVTGWGALSASLAARKQELDGNFVNFQNIVSGLAGTYRDLANTALRQYKIASDNYANELARLDRYNEDIRNHGQAMELIDYSAKVNKELSLYESNLKAGDIDPATGELIEQFVSPSGQVYDKAGYATDPLWTKSIQTKLDEIGKLESIDGVSNYIKTNYPNSPVTADMISKASEKYKVGWEELLALMDHESNLGTSDVAINNNNLGGITWSSSFPDNMKGTERPEGGNYVKFKTLQDGVNSVAFELNKRKATKKAPTQRFTANTAKAYITSFANKLSLGEIEWENVPEIVQNYLIIDTKKNALGEIIVDGKLIKQYTVESFTENEQEALANELNAMNLQEETKAISGGEDQYVEGQIYEVDNKQYKYLGNDQFEEVK